MKAQALNKLIKLTVVALLVLTMLPIAALVPMAAASDIATVNGVGYATLAEAVAAANTAAEGATVTLKSAATIEVDQLYTISGNVTIDGANSAKKSTLLRALDYTESFFEVQEGASLTLGSNLVIDGGWTAW